MVAILKNTLIKNTIIRSFGYPNDFKNLRAWYDIPDFNTITFNGSNPSQVAQIKDKSGNGYHIEQSTAGYQWKYGDKLINGLPAIYTENAAQMMTNTTGIPISGALTIFAVVKDVENDINQVLVTNGGEGESEAANWTYSWRFQNLLPQIFYERGAGTNVFVDGFTQIPSTDTIVYITRSADATASITFGHVKGEIDFSESDFGLASSGGNDSIFWIGSGFIGKLGELFIYDRLLTTTEINYLKMYLKMKWGI